LYHLHKATVAIFNESTKPGRVLSCQRDISTEEGALL